MSTGSYSSGSAWKPDSWKLLALFMAIALLAGIIGAALSAQFFVREGPQGPQGEQGLQGVPGLDGTDAILQTVQRRNQTQIAIDGYVAMQWFNLSDADPSMKVSIDVQQSSKVLALFSSYQILEPPASVWIRIVVDDVYNSSQYICSTGPPASGTYQIPGHTEFLTDSLDAGLHTITVQFLREVGSPLIMERTLTILEMQA